jgi:hypothetical protein
MRYEADYVHDIYIHVPKEKKSKLDSLGRKDTMNLQRQL